MVVLGSVFEAEVEAGVVDCGGGADVAAGEDGNTTKELLSVFNILM